MASEFVELTFKADRKKVFANIEDIQINVGDCAVIDIDNGLDIGRVSKIGRLASLKCIHRDVEQIKRRASENDVIQFHENAELEREAAIICREKIDKYHLQMKLVDVEYRFDRKKITFYFTADKRVDFRELVKDLAGHFKSRIELRQIGVRDEARRLGGCGICGQKLCCTSFIDEFAPISTQFAKDQNLSLNPGKLSGVCGRLMCCLAFEKGMYQEELKSYPDPGCKVNTENGTYAVQKVDIFRQKVSLFCKANEDYLELSLDDFNTFKESGQTPVTEGEPVAKDQ
jgi:cell fate regulator YaaT (PSP1 superfamily)